MSVFRFIRWIARGAPALRRWGPERDFTYVEDVAECTLAAAVDPSREVINLCGDSPARLTPVIERLEKLLGKKATIEHQHAHAADPAATWADITKARTELGSELRRYWTRGSG